MNSIDAAASPQKKIALFGGTFDPIHLGHIFIAQAAMEQMQLDQVIFLPCAVSPHKLTQQTASAENRKKMIELAIDHLPWAALDDYDLVNPPPNYSYLTVQAMTRKYPHAKLYWLMGMDQWQALPQWKNPHLLAAMVTFLVFSRHGEPEPREGYDMIPLAGIHPASSSAIRANIHGEQAKAWLDPRVYEWIKNHGLYGMGE